MIKAREILICMAIKYKGEWNSIYKAICEKEEFSSEEIEQTIKKINCDCLTILDDDYPECLKNIRHPPFVLFYYGDLSLIKTHYNCLSIVGSRECSEYGKESVEKLIDELDNEYIIVSGLASGIDSISHQRAIINGGKTIAVLGCGIDRCFPLENIDIYKKIKEEHLLISEYPPNTCANRHHFPERNRIIVGLSYGLLVAEAYENSGTLITSMIALNEGREVMSIPYPINSNSKCNELIKCGAALIQTGNDIKEAMGHFSKKS